MQRVLPTGMASHRPALHVSSFSAAAAPPFASALSTCKTRVHPPFSENLHGITSCSHCCNKTSEVRLFPASNRHRFRVWKAPLPPGPIPLTYAAGVFPAKAETQVPYGFPDFGLRRGAVESTTLTARAAHLILEPGIETALLPSRRTSPATKNVTRRPARHSMRCGPSFVQDLCTKPRANDHRGEGRQLHRVRSGICHNHRETDPAPEEVFRRIRRVIRRVPSPRSHTPRGTARVPIGSCSGGRRRDRSDSSPPRSHTGPTDSTGENRCFILFVMISAAIADGCRG